MKAPRTLDELIAFVEKEFECRAGAAGPYAKWDELGPITYPYYTLSRRSAISATEMEDCNFDVVRVHEEQAIREIYEVFLELIDVAPQPRRLIWRYPQKIFRADRQGKEVMEMFDGLLLEVRTRIAVPNLDWLPLDLSTPEGMPSRRITLPKSPNDHG